MWPRELGRGVPGFLYGVLEANLVWQGRTEAGGAADPDTGGTTLFVAPGLQYVTTRWILEAALRVPAAQDLNGTALEADYVLQAGFRVNL